ncbi:MAG: DUF4249 family protein [Ignavibacteria bacterium]|nr:DUF4249 family protein [Ignavibacteria bacterium]
MIFRLLPITVLFLVMLAGCEDPVTSDYVPELVVEGFMIAGDRMLPLRIYRSMPLNDTFSLRAASIPDASVTLLENGIPVDLRFIDDSIGIGYVPTDTSFRVKYSATYQLTVRALGKTATATAVTQVPFQWIRKPADTLQYPGRDKELIPADSLSISWQGQPGTALYVIGMECLDTAGYGKYLVPPIADTNNRIRDKEFDSDSPIANETVRYGPVSVANSAVIWAAFKWYGKHRIKVYCGDRWFQKWFQAVGFGRRSEYDYRLSNVEGGLGTFSGASYISAEIFLKKEVR